MAQQYQQDVDALRFEAPPAPKAFDVIDAAEHSLAGSDAADQLLREQQSLELSGEADDDDNDAAAEARRMQR